MPSTLGDRRAPLALLCLAALAFGGVGLAQATLAPREWSEPVVRDPWTERGAFHLQPLPRDGGAGDGAAPLPADEPGYLVTLAPLLATEFVWTIEDDRAPRVRADATLVARVGAGPTAFEKELDRVAFEGRAGEPLALEAIVDLEALAQEAASAHATPGGSWTLLATVRFATSAADRTLTSEHHAPLRYDAPLYVLPPPHAREHAREHGTRDVVHHQERAGLGGLATAPGALALSLGGALGLAILPHAGRHAA